MEYDSEEDMSKKDISKQVVSEEYISAFVLTSYPTVQLQDIVVLPLFACP